MKPTLLIPKVGTTQVLASWFELTFKIEKPPAAITEIVPWFNCVSAECRKRDVLIEQRYLKLKSDGTISNVYLVCRELSSRSKFSVTLYPSRPIEEHSTNG